MKEEEIFKKAERCAIGRSTFSVIDAKYNMKEKAQFPGPGQYGRFSDFGQKIE